MLNIGLDKPEECLDILERIMEKGRAVYGNILWDTVDSRFQKLISNMALIDKKRYNRLIKRYDLICENVNSLRNSVKMEIMQKKIDSAEQTRRYRRYGRVESSLLTIAEEWI